MKHSEIYNQEILEHYRHPQNYGRLKKARFSAYKINPLCGDEMDLYLAVDKKCRITDARFTGSGCAISIASASLFTENLKGKSLSALKKIKPESAIKNLGIPIGAGRRKCALLPYEALQEIFVKNE
jgi:nitrogen fixation protein NifU and related proteins